MPDNIIHLLDEQAFLKPHALALEDGAQRWSFAALSQTVAQWAFLLRDAGLRPGDRLGVCLKDHGAHLLARLAAARAGLGVLPVDWRVPLPERGTLARRFQVSTVLTEHGALIDGLHCLPVDDEWRTRAQHAPALPRVDERDLPVVLNLSSGTTGQPQASLITHAQYARRMQNNVAAFGNLASAVYLSISPLCFSAGSHFCLLTLLQGVE